MPRKNLLQLRHGNFSDWSTSNPILASGEPGIDINSNILKIGDGVSPWSDLHQIGGENLYYVKNGQGSIIRAGQCVYAKGAVGNSNSIEVGLFIGNGTIPEYSVMGLAKTDIGIGEFGYVSAFGTISNIDTYPNGNVTNLADAGEYWEEGTILYASPTTAGKLTSNRPSHDTILAIVLKRNNNGKLFVRPSWNPHLDDLHDVATSGATNGQFLQYNSLSGLWLGSSSGNFTNLFVNNTGVSLTGHKHSVSDITGLDSLVPTNVVFTTGSQVIAGDKTFSGVFRAGNNNDYFQFDGDFINLYKDGTLLYGSEENLFYSYGDAAISAGTRQLYSNSSTPILNWSDAAINIGNIADTEKLNVGGNIKCIGSGIFSSGLFVNGTGASLIGHKHIVSDITNFASGVSGLLPSVSGTGFVQTVFENNIYKIGVTGLQLTGSYVSLTGAERISGTKTFNNNVIVTGQFSSTSGYFKDYLSLNGTGVSITGHTHEIYEINNLQSTLNNKQPTGFYVSLSGAENISGTKTFLNNIIVTGQFSSTSGYFKDYLSLNGTGVSITGHAHEIYQITNLQTSLNNKQPSGLYVSLTGIENISGIKTFINNIIATGILQSPTGIFYKLISNGEFELNGTMNISAAASILANGPIIFNSNPYIVSGVGYFTSGLFVGTTGNAVPVSVSGHHHPYSEIDNFCTGVAECVNTPLLAGTGIILSFINGTGLFIHFSGTSNYISNTGNDTVSGVKTFAQQIIATGGLSSVSGYFKDYLSLNGTGVSITGHSHQIYEITNLQTNLNNKQPTGVYVSLTGIENIGGTKTFLNNVIVTGQFSSVSGYFKDYLSLNGTGVSITGHTHQIYQITNLQSSLDNKQPTGVYVSLTGIENISGTKTFLNNVVVTGQFSATSGYFKDYLGLNGTGVSITGHTHAIYQITNLQTALDGKQNSLTNPITGTGTTDYIARFSSSSGLTNSSIFDNGINTAIGINPSTYRLTVAGSGRYIATSATGSLEVLNIDGGSTGFNGANDANTEYSIRFDGCSYSVAAGIVQRVGAKIGMLKNGSWNEAAGGLGTRGNLVFYTNSGTIASPALTEKMRITHDGNVGILTSNPTHQLNVVGTGNFSQGLLINGSGVSITGHTHTISNISNFNSGVSGLLPTGTVNYIPKFGTGGSGLNNSSIFDNGTSVGISTSSISSSTKLEVNGTIQQTWTGSDTRFAMVYDNNYRMGINYAANQRIMQIFSTTADAGGHISFLTRFGAGSSSTDYGTEKLRITNSGYVGIGTTAPNTQLHVVGSGFFTSGLSVTGLITSTNGNFINSLQVNGTGVWHSGNLDGSNIVRITGTQTITGNKTFSGSTTTVFTTGAKVGIGIDSPSYLLDIYDYDTFSPFRAGDSNNNYITIGPPEDGAGVVRINGMDKIYLTTNAGDISITGSVSINGQTLQNAALGSATNGQLLIGNGSSFSKSTLTAGTGISISNGGGTITINTIGLQSSLTNPVTGTGTSNYLSKWNSASGLSNSLIYDNGINIGIGTDTPSASLHLVGTGIVGGDLSVSGTIFASTISGTDPVTISSSTASMIINDSTIFLNNETWVAGNLRLPNQTTNTLAIFDDNQNIISQTVPTLAELSYVSGISSNIQAQLDSKQATLTNPVTGTGIANHIAYWNSSSGIVSDSGQLYWDSTNNRLGIGILNPETSVHISGASASPIGIRFDNGDGYGGNISADNGALYLNSSTSTVCRLQGAKIRLGDGSTTAAIELTSNGTISQDGNGGGLSFSGTTAKLSNGLHVVAGNVGIGTISPSFLLDVTGVIRSSSYITANNEFRLNNAGFSRVATIDGGGGFAGGYNVYLSGTTPKHNSVGAIASYYYHSDGSIRFYSNQSQIADTNAFERMRIQNDGTINIGSLSPSGRLTIGSGIGSGANVNSTTDYNLVLHHSDMIIISPEDTSNNPVYTGITLLVSRPGAFQGGQTTLDFATRDRGNNFNRGVMARIVGGNASNTAAGSSLGGELSLQTAATGSSVPTDRLFINRDGNVGIGTITPTVKFHVIGSGLVTDDFSIGALKAYKWDGNAWGYDRIIFRSDVNNKITSDANGNYNWLVAGRNWTLSDVGNVGIGTTTPAAKFHISASPDNNFGTIMLTGTNISTHIGIAGGSDTVPFLASLSAGNIASSVYGWGMFYRNTEGDFALSRKGGSTSWIRCLNIQRSNGNIGIGTGVQATAPPEMLTVDGNLRLADKAGSIGNKLQFNRGGGTANDYTIGKEGNHLALSTANDSSTFRFIEMGYHAGSTWTPRVRINGFNGDTTINNLQISTSGTTISSSGTTTLWTIPITVSTANNYQLRVSAYNGTTSSSASWNVRGLAERNSTGNVNIIGDNIIEKWADSTFNATSIDVISSGTNIIVQALAFPTTSTTVKMAISYL